MVTMLIMIIALQLGKKTHMGEVVLCNRVYCKPNYLFLNLIKYFYSLNVTTLHQKTKGKCEIISEQCSNGM